MKNKTIIFLSVLIALMLGIIVSAVIYLYSTPEITPAPVAEKTQQEEKAPADEQVAKAEDPAPEAQAELPAEQPAPEVKAELAAQPAKADNAPAKSESAAAKSEFQVKNSGTGRMNTLKQASDNSLTLLDHNGKQLWKIPFPARIVGEPAQIDIYNNLKIQYLICAGNKLHLIDRLGRQVKNFPLSLPGTAKSGPKDVKKDKLVYWQIETSAGTVYFDKKSVKILNQLP